MSKQCDLSWCSNPARGKWCNSHWSNVYKHGVPNPSSLARRVGTRTLLAKTCTKCWELKQSSEFQHRKHSKTNKVYVSPYCKSCVLEYNKNHRPKNPNYSRDYQRNRPVTPAQRVYHAKYIKAMNNKTRDSAHHHQQPYTGADWVVLLDPKLSIGEKAKKLGRTYKAVSNQLYNYRKSVEAQIAERRSS